MTGLVFLVLAAIHRDQGTIDSPDFSRARQEAAVAATVRVVNPATDDEGSGALLRRSGPFAYVLTADHVVRGADELTVCTFSARSYPKPEHVCRSARVLARDEAADLALLRMPAAEAPPGWLRVCPPSAVPARTGFAALGVGCTADDPPTCRSETVRGRRKVRKPSVDGSAWYWETGQAPAKGRSGGPLLDPRGYLIGVCSGASEGKGYYSHPEEIHRFLKANGLRWLYEEDGGR
jgi:S1-C subfamily serine protease